MSLFNKHLHNIHGEISVKKSDRQMYTEIFDEIVQTIVEKMHQVDGVFKSLNKGQELFGSYSNGVRIRSPSEFDVYLVLKFPYPIDVLRDKSRPGFVHLHMSKAKEEAWSYCNTPLYNVLKNIVDYNNGLLRRTNFKNWMFDVIETAVERCRVRFRNNGYDVSSERHAVAYNVYVRDLNNPDIKISIDMVPAIEFGPCNWIQIRSYGVVKPSHFCNFMAVAKKSSYKPKNTFAHTFMMVNSRSERDILLNRQHLKPALRLLKSLRDKYEMNRLKSFFITNVFLWQVQIQPLDFWKKPLGDVFLYMLYKLRDGFEKGELKYFWFEEFNLLDILKPKEIREYSKTLNQIYGTMRSYLHQPNLSYNRVASYFDLPELEYDSESEYDSEPDYYDSESEYDSEPVYYDSDDYYDYDEEVPSGSDYDEDDFDFGTYY